jgi:predicted enzyme related to lactoylglutathione lyase
VRSGEFCWFDVKTRDVLATSAFFSVALGWKIAVDPDDWRQATKIAVDGRWIGGVSDLASPIYPPDAAPHIASYLAVPDVDAHTAAAQQAGARVVAPPSDVADQGRLATLVDPFGAGITLWQAGAFAGWPDGSQAPARMRHLGDRPDEARRFYADLLGVRAEFATGPAGWEVAVVAADLALVAQRVSELGAGRCEWSADSTRLRLVDPHGMRIAVVPA